MVLVGEHGMKISGGRAMWVLVELGRGRRLQQAAPYSGCLWGEEAFGEGGGHQKRTLGHVCGCGRDCHSGSLWALGNGGCPSYCKLLGIQRL